MLMLAQTENEFCSSSCGLVPFDKKCSIKTSISRQRDPDEGKGKIDERENVFKG
jgi:hypothetical protein